MYQQLADHYLNVSAEFGQFLYVWRACPFRPTRIVGVRHIVRGVDHLSRRGPCAMAAAVTSSGPRLEPAQSPSVPAKNLSAAGLDDNRRHSRGRFSRDAGVTMSMTGVDLVLLDGAFTLYPAGAQAARTATESGGLSHCGETPSSNRAIITYVRQTPANGYRTIPLPLGAHLRQTKCQFRTA